jgi:polyferredoxin
MDKVGLPRGLISYDTLANMDRRARGKAPRLRLVRPRTILYAAVIAIVGLVMLFVLATREPFELNVLHDRNPLYVTLTSGEIRNAYTIKLLNKRHEERYFRLSVEGLKDARIDAVGLAHNSPTFPVPADSLRSYRVLVTAPHASFAGRSHSLVFVATDLSDGTTTREEATFQGPPR